MRIKWITGSVMVVTLLFAAASWSQNGKGYRKSVRHCTGDCTLTQAAAPVQLSADEVKWLVYMREEEKLARDVYRNLYEQWGLQIFENIAASEQRHFDAIGVLIARYGLTDPAQGPGVFVDEKIRGLYEALMAKGIVSSVDALEVGVMIEETDIDDLEDAMKSTTPRDIDKVYANLLAGSFNHLDAFNSHLQAAQ